MNKSIIHASIEPISNYVFSQEHEKKEASDKIGIASIVKSSSSELQSFLYVSTVPNLCVCRVHKSSVFSRKSYRTLKRLSYSCHQSIRHRSELELNLRFNSAK